MNVYIGDQNQSGTTHQQSLHASVQLRRRVTAAASNHQQDLPAQDQEETNSFQKIIRQVNISDPQQLSNVTESSGGVVPSTQYFQNKGLEYPGQPLLQSKESLANLRNQGQDDGSSFGFTGIRPSHLQLKDMASLTGLSGSLDLLPGEPIRINSISSGNPHNLQSHRQSLIQETNSQKNLADIENKELNLNDFGYQVPISASKSRQHNSDFMYQEIKRQNHYQHQFVTTSTTPKGALQTYDQQTSTGSHQSVTQLIPFKQMSEPINMGPSRYQAAQQNTERSSLFSQATQVHQQPNNSGVVITQYSRPKTNSPFPPYGVNTAQSTRSAQKVYAQNINMIPEQQNAAQYSDQIDCPQQPTFQRFNSRGSQQEDSSFKQIRINNPPGNRSFHLRQQSREVPFKQAEGSEIAQQDQSFISNFNINGTLTNAAILMNSSIGSQNNQSYPQAPDSSFHHINDLQSPKQERHLYINEINQEDSFYQNGGKQPRGGGIYNSETKNSRRSPPQDPINPQFQQSQQVFMQNNFFIHQMLASPTNNNQLRQKGMSNPNLPQNTNQMPAFDASMSGGHGNPFFDLMEMSSVLSSTAVGDPLIDSTGTAPGVPQNINSYQSIHQQQLGYGIPNIPSPPMSKDFGFLMTQDYSKDELRVQVPIDLSQSSQSRGRINRLNKVIVPSQSNSNIQQCSDENNDISQLSNSVILGQSITQSYQINHNVQQWKSGKNESEKSYQNIQDLKTLRKQKQLSLLNQSYRDLHKVDLLSQSMMMNQKMQLTPQQAPILLSSQPSQTRINITDFSQQPPEVLQSLVNTNRNISGSRRQLQIMTEESNHKRGGSTYGNDSMFQSKFEMSEMVLSPPHLKHQPKSNEIHSGSKMTNEIPRNRISDPQIYNTNGSRENSETRSNGQFCIEMGKAKPKILKSNFNSAYHVFVPQSKVSSRRSNHRVPQHETPQQILASQPSKGRLQPLLPIQHQTSLERSSQMKHSSSINRDTIASHSQRANEFSPTNPSYYITFNQDSNADHHKFNGIKNLNATAAGSSDSGQHLQSSLSSTGKIGGKQTVSSGGSGGHHLSISETRRPRMQRSESKNSSHRPIGETELPQSFTRRKPFRRVEVPSKEIKNDNEEVVIKSANIVGMNRKIKVNRIVNKNTQQQEDNITSEASNNNQEETHQNFHSENFQKANNVRSRMGSIDNKNVSKLSEGNLQHKNVRSRKDEFGESPKRHNMSQIIEPISIHKFGSRSGIISQPITPTNGGGSSNNLLNGANSHNRRQSQQISQQQRQLLPPRHRSQQKFNLTQRKEEDRKIICSAGLNNGVRGGTDMIPTYNLLQQTQPSFNDGLNNSTFPTILKKPSQTKIETDPLFTLNHNQGSSGQMPLDRTASFQPPVIDKLINTSQSSFNRQHMMQQPLASTYEVSNGPQEKTKQMSMIPPRGNMSQRNRRIISREIMGGRDSSDRGQHKQSIDQYYASAQVQRSMQDSLPPSSSTTTFSQLVLNQHKQQALGMNHHHTQEQPNNHYETPRMGASSSQNNRQSAKNLKDHPKFRQSFTNHHSPNRHGDHYSQM